MPKTYHLLNVARSIFLQPNTHSLCFVYVSMYASQSEFTTKESIAQTFAEATLET